MSYRKAMPKNNRAIQFRNHKNQVMDLIDSLVEMLEESIFAGMSDENSILYNEINDLIEEANSCDSYLVLSEIVHRAKQIEHNLESWLSNYGKMTQELNWPDLSKEF